MKTVQDIQKLLNANQYSEAEEALLNIVRNGAASAVHHYMLGCLYNNSYNQSYSTKLAKNHFTTAIQATESIPEAFLELACLEQNSQHCLRILKLGLKNFPKNIKLYERLLMNTDPAGREEIFLKMVQDGITSRTAIIEMIETYIDLELYPQALKLIEDFTPLNKEQAMIIDLFRGLCFLMSGEGDKSVPIFESLIETDVGQVLEYAQYFGLIICRLRQSDLKSALNIFRDIPAEEDFDFPFDEEFGSLNISECYFYYIDTALTELLKATKNRQIIVKAKAIRIQLKLNGFDYPQQKFIADLRFVNKHLPTNLKFCLQLANLEIENGNYEAAHELTMQYLHNAAWHGDEVLQEADYSYVEKSAEKSFLTIQKSILVALQSNNYTDLKVLPTGPCVPLIKRLFINKQYQAVTEIADAMRDKRFEVLDILFEIAYSYGETSNSAMAKKCYEIYNTKFPGSDAVANNLGVIYDHDGELDKAKVLYQRALSKDKKSELYKRNLTRIIDIEGAAKNILKTDLATKKFLIALWYSRDIDDYLPDPSALLINKLSLSSAEARKRVQLLIEKKIIIQVNEKEHKYKCLVYRINPYIVPSLTSIEVEVELTTNVISVVEQITPESLAKIGYDNNLISCLKKLATFDLQNLLQRDLRETALSLLAGSYKTTLVLSGSIIETILLDLVLKHSITKYKMEDGKNRHTNRMDIGELLFVAEKENIITNHLYHLAQALREFRNLIHPGVEKRKSAISVTEQNARIAWDITRKLITEI